MRRALGFATLFVAAACGGGRDPAKAPPPLEDTCRVTIAPREAVRLPPPPLPPWAPSRIIVNVEMPLSPVARELDAHVPRRVAEEQNRGIGVAGHLNYTVDRGPFAAKVQGESLIVRTELRGHAEACASGRCYASCDPVAVATATVPLQLTQSFQFSPSKVRVAFVRGCEVRALGGMVKIDVTPMLEARMAPALRRVEREIDGRMPAPRPQAERLWKELSTPRPLPLGSCVIVNPRGIVQGPTTGAGEALRARFGVLASPELRTRCGEPPASSPFPSLAHDVRLPPDDDLTVALVSPIERAVSSLAPSDPFELGGARVRITKATATAAGTALDLDLAVRGEACGELQVRSALAWNDDGRSIRFTSPELDKAPPLTPPLAPDALRELAAQLASSMSDPRVEVKAIVDRATPLAVHARTADLVALVRVHGNVTIAAR